jgi:cob(I)alamin adenosyltransferase
MDGECGVDVALCFVNRLSDYFFVLSRFVGEEMLIKPLIWEK